MKTLHLQKLELKTFTEQNILDYCLLNSLNLENITTINLKYNKLTDISGIKYLKNLKGLYLNVNNLTDISVIKNLTDLKYLDIGYNNITDISVIKNFKNLIDLDLGYNKIKDISAVQYLNKLQHLGIINLRLESDQIKYINSCKNLKYLYCEKGFKDMSVLKQINENIEIYELL